MPFRTNTFSSWEVVFNAICGLDGIGMELMVIIGHRSSKSTLGANKRFVPKCLYIYDLFYSYYLLYPVFPQTEHFQTGLKSATLVGRQNTKINCTPESTGKYAFNKWTRIREGFYSKHCQWHNGSRYWMLLVNQQCYPQKWQCTEKLIKGLQKGLHEK